MGLSGHVPEKRKRQVLAVIAWQDAFRALAIAKTAQDIFNTEIGRAVHWLEFTATVVIMNNGCGDANKANYLKLTDFAS